MKISIGSKLVEGPWGGGNLFVQNITKYLQDHGHTVVNDLFDTDIDIILLTDPRSKRKSSSTFNHIEIKNYKKFVNKNVSVVQRINECDERKGTKGVNQLYFKASKSADLVIFVSAWLEKLYIDIGLNIEKSKVIYAGANKDIFNSKGYKEWNMNEKLKIVTHHWSNHENKGFNDYLSIDRLLDRKEWKDKIEFTFIGNMNNKYKFNNTKIIEPLSGLDLADELKKHHIYITASVNEPSGNHHIEAAQCGLPIIYKISGGIPEYCSEYGLGYYSDIEDAIQKSMIDYLVLIKKVKKYSNNSDKMCKEFLDTFKNLNVKNKKFKINNKYFLKQPYIYYLRLKNFFLEIINLTKSNLIKIIKKIFIRQI